MPHEYTTKTKGEDTYLIINCKGETNCSIADYPEFMHKCAKWSFKHNADLIVVSKVYERTYNKEQTRMVKELGALADEFERKKVWAPSRIKSSDCGKSHKPRYNTVVTIARELITRDPLQAYIKLRQVVKREKERLNQLSDKEKKCTLEYLKTLNWILKKFNETKIVKELKLLIKEMGEIPRTREPYHSVFEVEIKPGFVSSRVFYQTPEEVELLDSYEVGDAKVKIYSNPEKIENLYYVQPPEYDLTPDEYFLLSKTREQVASYRPEEVSFREPGEAKRYFKRTYSKTIEDLAEQNDIDISTEKRDSLASIVARYTIGFGMMELLLNDRKLTDIYIDSPMGQYPVYLTHQDHGTCETNVIFTEEEAQGIITRFRSISGRPFDEAHPILDLSLERLDTRVAAIRKPLAPEGRAIVLRLHKITPWTLPQYIDVNMINDTAAGLLSFLIDAQATTLVTGSRGAGKTSMTQALMLEILPSLRIILQEDTFEMPVEYMKKIGFKVQRLKTRSPISMAGTEAEVPPEEALRTALRLGSSVLILGEVRSKEAKVLYEAMRVGAAGNVVMGTIHGTGAYSVWDRVVNDLGVPSTSFKATDVVVTCKPVRFKGSLGKKRRLVGITEIGKHWYKDPYREGELIDILDFDTKEDKHFIVEDNLDESQLFEKISKDRGLTQEEIWEDINARSETKQFLVDMKKEYDIPKLLEGRYTVSANTKWNIILEEQRKEHGSINYEEAKEEWKNWVKKEQVKELVARRKQRDAAGKI